MKKRFIFFIKETVRKFLLQVKRILFGIRQSDLLTIPVLCGGTRLKNRWAVHMKKNMKRENLCGKKSASES